MAWWGWFGRGRGRWVSPWPGRGPWSWLPPWQRPGWWFGRGWCWWFLTPYLFTGIFPPYRFYPYYPYSWW